MPGVIYILWRPAIAMSLCWRRCICHLRFLEEGARSAAGVVGHTCALPCRIRSGDCSDLLVQDEACRPEAKNLQTSGRTSPGTADT